MFRRLRQSGVLAINGKCNRKPGGPCTNEMDNKKPGGSDVNGTGNKSREDRVQMRWTKKARRIGCKWDGQQKIVKDG